jgi:hypothetical protein
LKDVDGNPIDPEVGGVTPPDPDAPTTLEPPAEPDASTLDDHTPVTMADVAALNGIGLAPDRSDARVVTLDEDGDVFISAGMANDLEQHGWAIDPITGRKIVRKQDGE